MTHSIDSDLLRELKSQMPLHEYLRETVTLRFNGGDDWIGLCPFHNEDTPSFRVNHERYHCFGCNAHGDIIEWMKRVDKLTFEQAIQVLNREKKIIKRGVRAGPIVQYSDYEAEKALRIMQINYHANEFYRIEAMIGIDDTASAYLTTRFTDDQIAKFHIGYSPIASDRFISYMLDNGATYEELVYSSLAAVDSRGVVYARLRDRITIPLKNRQGHTLGFIGRIVPRISNQDLPKYLTPPNTAAFNKKRFLFGWPTAGCPFKTANGGQKVTIVEGPIDCISMWGSGINYVFALMGTSISKEQVNQLEHFADKVQILLDGDLPGLEGTFRATKFMIDAKFRTSTILLSDDLDPDTAVKERGKAYLNTLTSLNIKDYYTNKLMVKVPPEYDRTLLDTTIKPWVDDNVKKGYPHYNVVDWVMAAYPKYRDEIKEATLRMLNDYVEQPGGKRGLKEENVKAFIRAWVKPSRDVRRHETE